MSWIAWGILAAIGVAWVSIIWAALALSSRISRIEEQRDNNRR